jgi:alpha-amylase/alpha-mannosidase (GH57 family)
MNKSICIHGHFYQPPRENPWLEAIELQDSAFPYHDWNERVAAECYAPNAYVRFVDGQGRIERIVSNYSRISFNFGPTLLAWTQEKAPHLHQAVVAADQESRRRFSGHGSALAQGYNHIILPLANRRDKFTQVRWGQRDFEARFGRAPEGMWLPETAVDNESLDVLAELGLKFTLLAPHQASRVRPLGGGDWCGVSGGRVDPSMPYLVKLPSGRSIAVFFYDGPIARGVAFEGMLSNGENFARRLMQAFDDSRGHAQLVNIATDGETYGHHSPPWRHGPGLRVASHRGRRPGPLDHLRRIPGAASPHSRSRDPPGQLLELRARRGPLAQALRLQLRRAPGVEPALARAPPSGLGLAARPTGPPVRSQGGRVPQRPMAGAR